MGWAAHYIEKLLNKETVSFRPRGNSMRGKIESGQLVTVIMPSIITALGNGEHVLLAVGIDKLRKLLGV